MDSYNNIRESLHISYAAGVLPEAFELVIAAHKSLCNDTSQSICHYESMGGAFLQQHQTVSMRANAFLDCMARIDAPQKPDQHDISIVKHTGCAVLPAPVQAYVGGNIEQVRWQRLGRGVKQAILPTHGDATVRLLYIPAGQAVPDHGHGGLELTLVLQGAYRDVQSRFGRGDIEIADQDLEHTPIAEPGEDCICLAATDAPLRFNEFMPRMLQPLFKI